MFCGYSSIKGVLQNHMKYTEYAFGISEFTQRKIIKNFVDTDFTFCRKVRHDKGKSIFDSETICSYLPQNYQQLIS